MRRNLLGLAAMVLALAIGAPALAAKVVVLHEFQGGPDGETPQGVIEARDGALYGTTRFGGDGDCGTFFRLSPPRNGGSAWTKTVLYEFKPARDGCHPGNLVADKHGTFFGTTRDGGPARMGTIFKFESIGRNLAAGRWKKTIISSFDGREDSPWGRIVIGPDRSLYGMGRRAVFKLSPLGSGTDRWKKTVLASSSDPNGEAPFHGLTLGDDGALYGTTGYSPIGDPGCGCGSIYRIAPPAQGGTPWTRSVLHRFTDARPQGMSYPAVGVIFGRHGALYGATTYGGPGDYGTFFKLAPPARGTSKWTLSLLYRARRSERSPVSGLLHGPEGVLYGQTNTAIFKLEQLSSTKWRMKVLHKFDHHGDPETPLILGRNRIMYGVRTTGGSADAGAIFKLQPESR